MNAIRLGFQTYTWQMSYERYRDRLGHILDVMAAAGGAGCEPEVCMLGEFASAPARLREALDRRGLQLAALCLVADWRQAKETQTERVAADRTLDYLRFFPGTLLLLCQMPGKDQERRRERQRNALACINEVARRAANRGIASAFHPNSPPGSVFRTREDYDVMLEGLDASGVGFAPDSGHMLRGGMDPLATIESCRGLVKHLHFKDIAANGEWTKMGRGITDFSAIVAYLTKTGYDGWIMVEDESPEAERDPDAVTLANGKYLRDELGPVLSADPGSLRRRRPSS
jgi:inosose dehydratase